MSMHRTAAVLAALVVFAPPAHASFGGGGKSDPPPASSSGNVPQASATNLTPKQQAQQWYADAYEDVTRAKADLTAEKPKSAEKRFRRSLERATRAVELDSTYHEAWNLIGYAARKMSDYPRSLSAYRTCLRLKPDYAPAREYLGEALIETGDLKGAREQLVWLERLKAAPELEQLTKRLQQAEGAATDSSKAESGR